jgi:hypothetical protein
MLNRSVYALALFFVLSHCSGPGNEPLAPLKYKATGPAPETLALYEPWFGNPKHIPPSAVGYNSHDPAAIRAQIGKAKSMGISAFVIDWYGDREPFNDQTYALVQVEAAKQNFKVAMMYDESNAEEGATDEALADLTMFHETYLSAKSAGSQAYLTYQGRPLIFIFPTARHTDWARIRTLVGKWPNPPLLIQENLPGPDAAAFDGFYAWIQPGEKGWAADGSNWGESYLNNFYETMRSKYPDKIIVGGVWAQFNDAKASWGLNRHIAPRCGQTWTDTNNLWHKYFPPDELLPFVMIDTWNDHEEGTAIEDGLPSCPSGTPAPAQPSPVANPR